MEEIWNEKDLDSIYKYIDEEGKEGVLSVLSIYKEVSDLIKGMDYPPASDSKIFDMGLKKDRELPHGISLENPGDHKYVGKLSPDEIKEKERVLKEREPKAKENLDDIL